MLLQAWCIISKPSVNLNLGYSSETLNSRQNRRFFVPRDPEIWRSTLKNNRVPLVCCFKLCASFHSNQWIQTWVTVWKCQIWVQIDDFFCLARPLNFADDLEKQWGTSSMLLQGLCIVSKPLVNSNWSYRPKTLHSGKNLRFFCPAWPWNLMDDLAKQ